MKEIHITDSIVIYNDMPRGWISGNHQPSWHCKVYKKWKSMYHRCMDISHPQYEYYKNTHISEYFKYLSNYVKWIESQPNFEEFCATCDNIHWSVDKDIKNPNNRNYFPECMTLTTQSENSRESVFRNGCCIKNSNPSVKRISVIGISSSKILLFKSSNDAKILGFNDISSKYLNKIYKGYKWYKVNYNHNKKYRIKRM